MRDAMQEAPDQAAVDAAIAALNARDQPALAATLHFPHYRLAQRRMQIWRRPEDCTLEDFQARAGEGWDRSAWYFRRFVAAGPNNWIVARLDGCWGAQMRSRFVG